MQEILPVARRLAEHGVYLFFKHEAHFLNPLVPAECELLRSAPAVAEAAVRRVVLEILPARLPTLRRGIYSPVPIARSLTDDGEVDEVLERFRYEMIRVDADQVWWWQDRKVAPRIQRFFTEHLAFEPALQLYFFEYRVNPDWWDKCYMEAELTPMVGTTVVPCGDGLRVTLNNGRRDLLDLGSLRLDQRERLLCSSREHGEILFSDSLRFSLLKGLSEDCRSVRIGEELYRLHWPDDIDSAG